MKLVTRLAFLGVVALSQSAWADVGPYYVSSTGFCNVKKIYVNTLGDIYGTETGCPSMLGNSLMGSVVGSAVVTSYASSTANTQCISVYSGAGTFTVGCSSGTSVTYNNGRWTIQELGSKGGSSQQVQYKYTISTETPDIEQTKNLPSVEQ